MACRTLVPRPGIEPRGPLAVKAPNPNVLTTRALGTPEKKIFLTSKAKKLNMHIKNLTLFFRYSAVSLKRKFSQQPKKQNSSITEGCRCAF